MIDLRKEKAFKMVYEHYYDYIYNYFFIHSSYTLSDVLLLLSYLANACV